MNIFRLDCCPTDILEAQYIIDIHKSQGGELIQVAAADTEDVNAAELHCRSLCVILPTCSNITPEFLTDKVMCVFSSNYKLLE
jgi:hypothetical protein